MANDPELPELTNSLTVGRITLTQSDWWHEHSDALDEAIARGEIPRIRIGRRILIPRVGLERLLDSAGGSGSAET